LKQNTRIEDNATLKKKNTIQWCYFLDYYGMKDIHPYLILQLQEEEWLVLQYRVLWRGGAGVIPSIGAANLELFETFKCMAHSLLRVNPLLFFFFFFGGGGLDLPYTVGPHRNSFRSFHSLQFLTS
jgi:hypothetical protein